MNYLTEFQPFAHKSELNKAVSSHLERHQRQLNETDRRVLMMLSRYAVKYPGAAHLKIATIAQTIKKSDRTVRRSIEKLEQLQVIKRHHFSRVKTGGQGANLYIFKPYNPPKKSPIIKEIPEARVAETVNPEPVTHYARFQNLVRSYTSENYGDTASQLYRIYRAQAIRLMKFTIHADKGELFESLALQAVMILFQATKKKNIHNLFGYYDGIYRELIDKTIFSDAFMDYDLPIDIKLSM